MSKIEGAKRKKRSAFIWITVLSIFLLGFLIQIDKREDNASLVACIIALQLWTIFYVHYERISAKIEILEELQEKDSANEGAP